MKGFLLFVCVPLFVISGYFGVKEWHKYQMHSEVYHVVGGCLATIDRGYTNNSIDAEDVTAALKILFEVVDEFEQLNQNLVYEEGRIALKHCHVVAQGFADKLSYFSLVNEEFLSSRMGDKSTLKNKDELEWRLSVIARYREIAVSLKRFNADLKESMYEPVSNSNAPDIVKRNYFSAVNSIKLGQATFDWLSLSQASQNAADYTKDLYQFLFDRSEFFDVDENARIVFNNDLVFREYEKKAIDLMRVLNRLDQVYSDFKKRRN